MTDNAKSAESISRDTSQFDIMEVVRQRALGNTSADDKKGKVPTKDNTGIVRHTSTLDPVETVRKRASGRTNDNGKSVARASDQTGIVRETSAIDLMEIVRKRASGIADDNGKAVTDRLGTVRATSELLDRYGARASGEPSTSTDHPSIGESGDVLPRPTQHANGASFEVQPGAYSGLPGGEFARIDNVNMSVLGAPVGSDQREESALSTTGDYVSSDGQGLAEATPVDTDAPGDMEAQPIDLQAAAEKRKLERHKLLKRSLLVGAIFLTAAVAVALAFSFGKKEKIPEMPVPTVSPSVSPTTSPTSAPTGALNLQMGELPSSTLQSLMDSSTPQWKAKMWLEGHPQLPTMSDWRKVQLFALVTFFYAMEGPNWPQYVRDDWLLYDKSECYWFSNEFGGLIGADGTAVAEGGIYGEGNSYGVLPCNEEGEFQLLLIAQLGLSQFNPFIPPEIELLTSLSFLDLSFSKINASLSEFLPSRLYKMTNLISLVLDANTLWGTIPTELGLLTNLVQLAAPDNSLSGLIHDELCLLTNLRSIRLSDNHLSGTIPSELGLMKNMTHFLLQNNALTGSIPRELGMLKGATHMLIYRNLLTGSIPTELGQISNMLDFATGDDGLSGVIPSEIGLMTSATSLFLVRSGLTGAIPTEIGEMSSLMSLVLRKNNLDGPIPSELGKLANVDWLVVSDNLLSGSIPTQLGLLSSLVYLWAESNQLTSYIPSQLGKLNGTLSILINNNKLTGAIPSALGLLLNLVEVHLHNNSLTGLIPNELQALAINGSLLDFSMENNVLSGIVPQDLCLMGQSMLETIPSLSFDCSDELCGCCWCPCTDTESNTTNSSIVCPISKPPGWPGNFPAQDGSTNAVTINVFTDDHPEETLLAWSTQVREALEWIAPPDANTLHSYTFELVPNSTYKLQIYDQFGDGICCGGWLSITNSTPSLDHANGSVMWDAPGTFGSSLEVLLWVDAAGNVEVLR